MLQILINKNNGLIQTKEFLGVGLTKFETKTVVKRVVNDKLFVSLVFNIELGETLCL